MRIISILILIFLISGSCNSDRSKQNKEANQSSINSKKQAERGILIAKDIIYDVVIIAETDDEWEKEMVSGYKGDKMIDDIFKAVYAERVNVIDYHTSAELSPNDIKELESDEMYNRENIGKIQFTEDWYYNTSTLMIEKEIKSVVFGYRKGFDDLDRVGYLAAFKIEFR